MVNEPTTCFFLMKFSTECIQICSLQGCKEIVLYRSFLAYVLMRDLFCVFLVQKVQRLNISHPIGSMYGIYLFLFFIIKHQLLLMWLSNMLLHDSMWVCWNQRSVFVCITLWHRLPLSFTAQTLWMLTNICMWPIPRNISMAMIVERNPKLS